MEGERKGVWEGGREGVGREEEEEDNERVKGWEIGKEHCLNTQYTGKTAKRYSWLRKHTPPHSS